jgi:EAL domain-containing protein (putative c-di-GMP-specific phosphodiesterase class I)
MTPTTLFVLAEHEGSSDELEIFCMQQAIRDFQSLTVDSSNPTLFLNLSGRAGSTLAPFEALEKSRTTCGLAPGNIAIEVLEDEITHLREYLTLIHQFRERGYLIALDDMGTGHSNLDRVPLIRPDVLKIDRSLIACVDTDYHKQGAVKTLVDLSRRIGALVVVEGVETENEALVSLELGVDLFQGYLLDKPHPYDPHETQRLTPALTRAESLARTFRSYMGSKVSERRRQHVRFQDVVHELLGALVGIDVDAFDAALATVVRHQPTVESVYILDDTGIQVTSTIRNAHARRRIGGADVRSSRRDTDHSLKEYFYMLRDVDLPRYTTDPYVSLVSGRVIRTLSQAFGPAANAQRYVLCVNVLCQD